jgi:nitroimidazol reductase NimA-like FMN-containing flavoprotein (pyridoxamine 5'-phosphate oxidase superfamily)/GNAT superfamily N-acetyltransferase
MSTPLQSFSPGNATRVRFKNRAAGEPELIAAIIDESLVAHVAYVSKDGLAQCLPMAFGRVGTTLYLHGAVANAHLQAVEGGRCSLTFTLLDGFVFARSALHHSMNYRCVVAIGETRHVTEPSEKRAALTAILEHAARGRSEECVGMTEAEVRSTRVVAVDVQEAVAKRRSGPPLDEVDDVEADSTFSGVVNLRLHASSLSRDPSMKTQWSVPRSVRSFAEQQGADPILEKDGDGLTLSTDPTRLDMAWLHGTLSREAYWALGLPLDQLTESLEHSLVFGAYCDGRQVAFARVMTDRARLAYLGDVIVDARHRGNGIGRRLVEFVLEHPTLQRCDRIILGTRDAQALYEKLGFVAPQYAYMVRRNPRCST